MASNSVGSAPERFQELLPWLNGDAMTPDEARRAIARFLAATALAARQGRGGDAVGLRALSGSPWTPENLEGLRIDLNALLRDSMPLPNEPRRTWGSKDIGHALPSLRFLLGRTAGDQKVSALTAAQRREYFGARAFQVLVIGELRDLLLYAVMRTLAEPGAVVLSRCPAPAQGNRSQRCGRWFVAIGRRRGRPAVFCSDACRVRSWETRR